MLVEVLVEAGVEEAVPALVEPGLMVPPTVVEEAGLGVTVLALVPERQAMVPTATP